MDQLINKKFWLNYNSQLHQLLISFALLKPYTPDMYWLIWSLTLCRRLLSTFAVSRRNFCSHSNRELFSFTILWCFDIQAFDNWIIFNHKFFVGLSIICGFKPWASWKFRQNKKGCRINNQVPTACKAVISIFVSWKESAISSAILVSTFR